MTYFTNTLKEIRSRSWVSDLTDCIEEEMRRKDSSLLGFFSKLRNAYTSDLKNKCDVYQSKGTELYRKATSMDERMEKVKGMIKAEGIDIYFNEDGTLTVYGNDGITRDMELSFDCASTTDIPKKIEELLAKINLEHSDENYVIQETKAQLEEETRRANFSIIRRKERRSQAEATRMHLQSLEDEHNRTHAKMYLVEALSLAINRIRTTTSNGKSNLFDEAISDFKQQTKLYKSRAEARREEAKYKSLIRHVYSVAEDEMNDTFSRLCQRGIVKKEALDKVCDLLDKGTDMTDGKSAELSSAYERLDDSERLQLKDMTRWFVESVYRKRKNRIAAIEGNKTRKLS